MSPNSKAKKLLTVDEKVLLHLFELPHVDDYVDIPFEFTQDGIAQAIGIRLNHVSRAVGNLQGKGLIKEVKARVFGKLRKRKSYFLTENGYNKAKEIRDGLAGKTIKIRDLKGKDRKIKMKDLDKYLDTRMHLIDVLNMIEAKGKIDCSTLEEKKPVEAGRVTHFYREPEKEQLLDRTQELKNLIKLIESEDVRLVAIHGPKGIGKSALTFMVVDRLKDKYNMFWYGFEQWDTMDDVLKQLSIFANKLGKSGLSIHVEPVKNLSLSDTVSLLQKKFRDSGSVLIFDSTQDADEDIAKPLSKLIKTFERLKGVKVLVLGRDPDMFGLDEVVSRKSIFNMKLGGLDPQSSRSLIDKKIPSEEFERIYKLVEGNPLYLKLINSQELEIDDKDEYTPEELALLKYLKAMGKK